MVDPWTTATTVAGYWHEEDFLLLEDGSYLLIEDGSRLMQDSPPGDPWVDTSATTGVWN